WSFLDHLGLLALKRGRPFDAAQVLGCADELNQRSGYVRQFNELRARDQLLEALRANINPTELARLMKAGGRLTADEAARLALAT
ncbi:MAG: hypothetical protein M3496_01010, partial [Pseudomonadota bacterium]|nr:hypothetical protein [Pseudomonadota bacterium]